MDLMVKIGYNEVLNLIKQLPASKIKQLQADLNQDFISRKAKEEISTFQLFLLSAPTMTSEDFEDFDKRRKNFSEWRAKN
jgi:hypothetical protein